MFEKPTATTDATIPGSCQASLNDTSASSDAEANAAIER